MVKHCKNPTLYRAQAGHQWIWQLWAALPSHASAMEFQLKKYHYSYFLHTSQRPCSVITDMEYVWVEMHMYLVTSLGCRLFTYLREWGNQAKLPTTQVTPSCSLQPTLPLGYLYKLILNSTVILPFWVTHKTTPSFYPKRHCKPSPCFSPSHSDLDCFSLSTTMTDKKVSTN